MKFSWNRVTRKTHYWASLFVALPLLVVIATGILLLLKKEVAWIQPPTAKSSGVDTPEVGFAEIMQAVSSVSQAEVAEWADIDRLDVRPSKGLVKVRSQNRWEVQVDLGTGKVLQAAFRRSDLIESLHDGSFFHPVVKFWVFLPAAIVLLAMWFTGLVLFAQPLLAARRRRMASMG